jgi:hypothetical protein
MDYYVHFHQYQCKGPYILAKVYRRALLPEEVKRAMGETGTLKAKVLPPYFQYLHG